MVISRIRWLAYVARTKNMRNVCNISIEQLECEKTPARSSHRQEDNIKMHQIIVGSKVSEKRKCLQLQGSTMKTKLVCVFGTVVPT
jgi:hypothetical protein